jgi:hypothetical protein
MTRQPSPLSHDDVRRIVSAYGDAMGSPGGVLRDVSQLPYPKARIKQALIAAIRLTPQGAAREQLKSGLVMLGDWQDRGQADPAAAMMAEGNALLVELRPLGL